MIEEVVEMSERLYVMRLWRETDGGWRASLKHLGTKEARYFHSFAALAAFLCTLKRGS